MSISRKPREGGRGVVRLSLLQRYLDVSRRVFSQFRVASRRTVNDSSQLFVCVMAEHLKLPVLESASQLYGKLTLDSGNGFAKTKQIFFQQCYLQTSLSLTIF